MRYVTIPEADGEFNTATFLIHNVWPRPGWRNPRTPERIDLLISCMQKFDGCAPGDTVELTDGEHEALAEEAAMQDVEIKPAMILHAARIQTVIFNAARKSPQAIE